MFQTAFGFLQAHHHNIHVGFTLKHNHLIFTPLIHNSIYIKVTKILCDNNNNMNILYFN